MPSEPKTGSDDTETDAFAISSVVEDYLLDKGKGRDGESGNYRRHAEREIDRFLEFLSDRPGSPATFEELSVVDLREYARYLSRQGWAEGTIKNYYAHVSGFLGWASREGHLSENPAQRTRAKEPLPEDTGRKSGEQQAWSREHREQLLSYVDEQAREAIDAISDDPKAAIKDCRNRALVNLLCFSGVRGAEILADVDDDRRGRDGLRWSDLSLADNSLQVLAKKQRWDDRALPAPAVPSLERLKQVLDPPSDDWPVFPSLSYSTLVQDFSNSLLERGYDTEEIEEIRLDKVSEGNLSMIELCAEYGVAPSAMTTHGGRDVMKRLTDRAGIELDDDTHGYLAPHGARRAAGEVMVRKYGHGEAARLLDNSEQVVREHYSHIEAGELADLAAEAFDEAPQSDNQDSTE
jgi:integrase